MARYCRRKSSDRKYKRINKKQLNNNRVGKKYGRMYLIDPIFDAYKNREEMLSPNRRLSVKLSNKRTRFNLLNIYWRRKGIQYKKSTIEGI